jgi:CheY-like chemotaxis protein
VKPTASGFWLLRFWLPTKIMRRTILLADDSPTIRRLVKQTFADGDFDVIEVSNGEAAIKMLEEMRPNVVLADIYMPGQNGYQVCAHIRNQPGLANIPVILLVGAFDAFDEEGAKRAGATANITKPFEPKALIELVTSILQSDTQQAEAPARSRVPAPAEPVAAPVAGPVAAPVAAPVAGPVAAPVADDESQDLFGLETIFKEEAPAVAASVITDADVDRIADRVIKKLSSQVIESIAWDIVPDITEKIVREELKRADENRNPQNIQPSRS